jgi:hypothetical protein
MQCHSIISFGGTLISTKSIHFFHQLIITGNAEQGKVISYQLCRIRGAHRTWFTSILLLLIEFLQLQQTWKKTLTHKLIDNACNHDNFQLVNQLCEKLKEIPARKNVYTTAWCWFSSWLITWTWKYEVGFSTSTLQYW